MIRYDKLWETMEARGITQYRLIKQYHFSAGQIGRLKKNLHVSTHTLETLCEILSCGLSDIAEYVSDKKTASGPETLSEANEGTFTETEEMAQAESAAAMETSDTGEAAPDREAVPASKRKKNTDEKADKPKKSGKAKKADKKTAKKNKDGKKGR